jgi:hypothetical protein
MDNDIAASQEKDKLLSVKNDSSSIDSDMDDLGILMS